MNLLLLTWSLCGLYGHQCPSLTAPVLGGYLLGQGNRGVEGTNQLG